MALKNSKEFKNLRLQGNKFTYVRGAVPSNYCCNDSDGDDTFILSPVLPVAAAHDGPVSVSPLRVPLNDVIDSKGVDKDINILVWEMWRDVRWKRWFCSLCHEENL